MAMHFLIFKNHNAAVIFVDGRLMVSERRSMLFNWTVLIHWKEVLSFQNTPLLRDMSPNLGMRTFLLRCNPEALPSLVQSVEFLWLNLKYFCRSRAWSTRFNLEVEYWYWIRCCCHDLFCFYVIDLFFMIPDSGLCSNFRMMNSAGREAAIPTSIILPLSTHHRPTWWCPQTNLTKNASLVEGACSTPSRHRLVRKASIIVLHEAMLLKCWAQIQQTSCFLNRFLNKIEETSHVNVTPLIVVAGRVRAPNNRSAACKRTNTVDWFTACGIHI